jgi:gamma-glutamyltranspeptidase/glutathione hydrolase
VLQAVINLVDQGMSRQEAVETPRIFSWGRAAALTGS